MVAWRDIPGNSQAFDHLVDLASSGDTVGFVGAGASAGLYPLWPRLIAQLADAAVAAGAPAAFKEAWCGMDPLAAARLIRKRLDDGPFADRIRASAGGVPVIGRGSSSIVSSTTSRRPTIPGSFGRSTRPSTVPSPCGARSRPAKVGSAVPRARRAAIPTRDPATSSTS